MKLSDDLKKWRSDRPDEWTMDRFIRKAEELESNEHKDLLKDIKSLQPDRLYKNANN